MKLKDTCLLEEKLWPTWTEYWKSRDITLPTKVHLVKAMIFPIVMYGCESWTIKKAENWKIDTFELCCWRRLLRVPWTARRSYPSILKEISPEYSLEGLMLWPPDEKNWLNGKDPDTGERLKAGGERNDRGWDGWMSSPTGWTWVWESSGVWCWTGKPCMLQQKKKQQQQKKNGTLLSDWTKLITFTTPCWKYYPV